MPNPSLRQRLSAILLLFPLVVGAAGCEGEQPSEGGGARTGANAQGESTGQILHVRIGDKVDINAAVGRLSVIMREHENGVAAVWASGTWRGEEEASRAGVLDVRLWLGRLEIGTFDVVPQTEFDPGSTEARFEISDLRDFDLGMTQALSRGGTLTVRTLREVQDAQGHPFIEVDLSISGTVVGRFDDEETTPIELTLRRMLPAGQTPPANREDIPRETDVVPTEGIETEKD